MINKQIDNLDLDERSTMSGIFGDTNLLIDLFQLFYDFNYQHASTHCRRT